MEPLTAEELDHLSVFNQKMAQIADFTKVVIEGWQTGLILNGEGGIGKSYTVEGTLRRMKVYKTDCHHKGRVTSKGLFDALELYPNDIHLVEDAESLYKDKTFSGLGRMALHSQDKSPHPLRVITWRTNNGQLTANFTGGLIIIGNQRFDANDAKMADFRALGTRCPVIDLDVSNEEIKAKAKELCMKGYSSGGIDLTADECWEVFEHMVAKFAEAGRSRYDLRLMGAGFHHRCAELAGHIDSTWQELLDAQIKRMVTHKKPTRADEVFQDAKAAYEIDKMKIPYEEKLKLFAERTGKKGKATYSRAITNAIERFHLDK